VKAGGDAQVGMFRDPVHLSDAGAAYVAEWMVPQALAVVDG
jgi:hypothetical protein